MLHSSYRLPLALENQCYPLSFSIDSQSIHIKFNLAIDQEFHISQLSTYKITFFFENEGELRFIVLKRIGGPQQDPHSYGTKYE